MVWKRLIFIFAFFIVSLGFALETKAYQVYPDGTISTSIVTYFDSVLNNYASSSDYIIWRDSQYIYHLVVGNLSFDDDVYTSDSCDIYTLNTYQQYNTTYSLGFSHLNNFSLDNSNRLLVYSSLGHMPNVQERGSFNEIQVLFVLVLFGIYFLVWNILKFGSR